MWNKILYSIVAISFVILLRPSYIWGTSIPGIAMILFCFILFGSSWKKVANKKILFAGLLLLLCLYGLRDITNTAVLSFLILLILLASDKRKTEALNYCRSLYAILLVVSMAVFVLVVYVGIDLPSYIIDASNQNKEHTYYQYPMLVVPNDIMHPDHTFRFCFLLDEPGAVGTLATIFLLIDHFSLKKWQNIILFLSGLFSLSLFFFICSFFFLVILKIRSIKGVITLLLIGIAVGAGFWYLRENYNEVSTIFENRLVFEKGKLSGDNRSNDSFDKVYENFLYSGDDVLFGKGVGAHNKIAPDIQTYKMIIYDNGILYVILVLLFFGLYAYTELQKYPSKFLLYSIFFLALYYQRPAYVFEFAYFFLLILVPTTWNQNLKNEELDKVKLSAKNNHVQAK